MSQTLYLRPDLNWALFGTVSGGSVDVESAHENLVDGLPLKPLRLTDISAALTIVNTQKEVNLIAICHHLLAAGTTVAVSGDQSGSIEIPRYGANGIPHNAWELLTAGSPTDVDNLTLTIAQGSPADDIVIGEVFAGKALALEPSLAIDDHQFTIQSYMNTQSSNPLSGVPEYSEHAVGRPISGSGIYDQDGLDAIIAWYESQDYYAYKTPSFLVEDSDDPLCGRVVYFASPPTWQKVGPDPRYRVHLNFLEVPRTKW